ncbi:MAG: ATP-binding protein [Candidatus Promineifilaceae bacterium]
MRKIRQHLGWKLFISYIVVIFVGVVSLAVAAEFHAPSALERHMANMGTVMGDGMMGGMMTDLTVNFRTAVNEILLVAALIATGTAVAVSTFVTRRIVQPIQQMKTAARRIANGRYEERIQIGGEDELAELAETFNNMATKLSETETRRRRLIGDVAHELRTPLSSIQGVMEGLADGILPAEPATFADIQREVRRLQRLVQDLEELSRAEAGQIMLETAVVTPDTFIRPASERLRLQFEEKSVALTTDIPSNLPPVNVDVSRMTQVVLNLLGNALQYTPPGGQVSIRCSVSSNQPLLNTEHCLLITVKDTGIGIAPEHLPHIFERFYRVDKSRARSGGGSGIGLTISKHLVEMHNGRLTASSPGPGQGSTFTIALPLP